MGVFMAEPREPDVDLLLSTGAMTGPYRRAVPITSTWRVRVRRALRRVFFNLKGPRL